MPETPTQPQVAEKLLGERSPRLTSVDALRGIAALAVVFAHLPRDHQGHIDGTFLSFLPLDFGTLGVPVFLVISGFCIHLAVARRALAGGKTGVDWATFWKRRFYRLYPPYLAAIAFSLLAYFLVSSYGQMPPAKRITSPWTDIASHLLLVHNLLPNFAESLFNPAFWTLALEEQLYAMFALLLVMRRRVSIVTILWTSLAVAVVWRWGMVITQFAIVRQFGIDRDAQVITIGSLPSIGAWSLWPFAYWFLWVLGAVAAEAFTGTITLPRWCYSRWTALAFVAAGVPTFSKTLGRYAEFWLTDEGAQGWLRMALNMISTLSPLFFGVVAFIVLNRWVRAEQEDRFASRWATWLTALGVFSYSLYLVHVPTMAILQIWLPIGAQGSVADTLLRMAVYVPICVGVAYAFFLGVERHFLRHHKDKRPAPASSLVPAV